MPAVHGHSFALVLCKYCPLDGSYIFFFGAVATVSEQLLLDLCVIRVTVRELKKPRDLIMQIAVDSALRTTRKCHFIDAVFQIEYESSFL